MRKLVKVLGVFASVSWLSMGFAPVAFAQATSVVVTTCGTQTYATTASSGSRQYPTQDTTGAACGNASGGGGSNASVGVIGAAAPASGTQAAGKTAAGNLVAECVATDGVFCTGQSSSSVVIITKTTLVANTSTTVCPTQTNPFTQEIWFKDATSIGIGLKGQALSTDAWGTGATAADIVVATAGTIYTIPAPYSTIITARSAGTPSVTCIQTPRP